MRKACFCCFLLLTVSSTHTFAGPQENFKKVPAKIQNIVSADTYDVLYQDGTKATIKLYGLKTPSPETEIGRIAKQHVEGLVNLLGNDIVIIDEDNSKAKIYLSEFYIPDELMNLCLGEPDSNGDKNDLARWAFAINNGCIPNKAGIWRESIK